jgi:hypothetical protein
METTLKLCSAYDLPVDEVLVLLGWPASLRSIVSILGAPSSTGPSSADARCGRALIVRVDTDVAKHFSGL